MSFSKEYTRRAFTLQISSQLNRGCTEMNVDLEQLLQEFVDQLSLPPGENAENDLQMFATMFWMGYVLRESRK